MNTLVKYFLKNKAVTWLLLVLVLFGGPSPSSRRWS